MPEEPRPPESFVDPTMDEDVYANARPRPEVPGYRLLEPLGEGGMGVVYEAEQLSPKRRVAIKIVRAQRAFDENVVRMFRSEAQALARLTHPSIAAIHAFGRTSEDLPFFAMELVRGSRLDEYLVGRPDPLADRDELRFRLQLFLAICEPVAYAHQKAVIHRDLKPANIFVLPATTSSVTSSKNAPGHGVKILDFGMARIVDSDLATIQTDAGRIQGTIAYMSPEQARADPQEIDLRSDVYALGVILYSLIAGRLPYETLGKPIHEAVRVVCEEKPAPISEGRRAVDRDLATIVGKALEKDPARRYDTVAALAGDVHRYLTSQPILARPPSAAYQLSLLVRRHRVAAVGVMVVIALLLAFAGTMTWMTRLVAEERDRARVGEERARSIAAFAQSIFEAADPDRSGGEEVTARELLEVAARKVREGDLGPRVRAAQMFVIGRAYRTLGLPKRAEPLLSEARNLLGQNEDATVRELWQIDRELAWVLRRQQRVDEATQILNRWLEANDDTAGISLAEKLDGLAELATLLDDSDPDKERLFETVLQEYESSPKENAVPLATHRNNFATYLKGEGEYERAEKLFFDAIETLRTHRDARRSHLASALSNLGDLYRDQRRCEEALPFQREALDIETELFGADSERAAASRNNIADCAKKAGQLDLAEREFRSLVDFFDARGTSGRPQLSVVTFNLGETLLLKGDIEDAERNLLRSLHLTRDLYGPRHPDVADTLGLLGAVSARAGRFDEARQRFDEAFAILDENPHSTILEKVERYHAELVAEE